MFRPILLAAGIVALSAGVALSAPQKKAKPKPKPAAAAQQVEPPVTARQENQFVTVDEFLKAGRSAGTAVSVEGYAVVGMKSGTGVKLVIVDSVDHVLNAADANKFAAGGASAVITAPSITKRPSLGLSNNGMFRFTMFTGNGMAQKSLHDTVAKLRVTGRAKGKAIQVASIEFADDNGDWKKL